MDLVNRMFLPHVYRWARRTLAAKRRLSDDDVQMVLVDVTGQLGVKDCQALRYMAALPCQPATQEAEVVDGVNDDVNTYHDGIPSDEVTVTTACEMLVAMSHLRAPRHDERDVLIGTPIQQRLRAMHRFALLRRLEGRIPLDLRPERVAGAAPLRFTGAAIHAGTRTLERAFNEQLGNQGMSAVFEQAMAELSGQAIMAAVMQTVEAMPARRRRIFLDWLIDGLDEEEIAYADHARLVVIRENLSLARAAVREVVDDWYRENA